MAQHAIDDDPVLAAWNNAPEGKPLTEDELAMMSEGLEAIDRGEVVSAEDVRRQIEQRSEEG